MIRLSVPAQGVLGGYRGGDDSSTSRVVSTVLAVAGIALDAAVTSEIPAEESTTHHSGAAGRPHVSVGRDGAVALVTLPLALVTTSNNEHGSTISRGNGGGTDGNTGGLGLLAAAGVISASASSAKGLIVVRTGASRERASTTSAGAASKNRPEDNVNSRVDLSREVVDDSLRVVVEQGVRAADVNLQLSDLVCRVVHKSLRSDVAEGAGGIVWNDAVHDGLRLIEATSVGKGLRQMLEKLGSSHRLANKELIVDTVQEGDLDE